MIKLILRPLLTIFFMLSFVTIVGISLWVIKDTWIVILGIVGGFLLLSAILGRK